MNTTNENIMHADAESVVEDIPKVTEAGSVLLVSMKLRTEYLIRLAKFLLIRKN